MILIWTFLVNPMMSLYYQDHKAANLSITCCDGMIFLMSFCNLHANIRSDLTNIFFPFVQL